MYEITFLPIALEDMVEIARYISHELNNPSAANRLSEKMIESAEGLNTFPYANQIHTTIRPLKHEFRKLIVDNYIMFYWVEEEAKQVVIARVIYGSRNYGNLLE